MPPRHSHRALYASAAFALLTGVCAYATVQKTTAAPSTQFARASQMQQALEARPVSQRTRKDYDRAITAYQRVYSDAPTSPKADPSVVAAAGLLEEMGRQFKDPAILRSAIAEYQFLRREYPGSKARIGALYRIGEIYHDDLHDKTQADAAFREFIEHYPNHPFSAEARRQLKEPVEQAAKAYGPPQAKKSVKAEPATSVQPAVSQKTELATKKTADDDDEDVEDGPTSHAADLAPADSTPSTEVAATKSVGPVAHVLAIRHWSTSDSTRVAIDLDHRLKYYEAQRIDNPDRLFFDLYDTRLGHSVSDKSVDVGDGFLKKIRVAQYQSQRTRVVLDLDELTDYRVSLEPNPWRLLIEIRNKKSGDARTPTESSAKPPPAESATLAPPAPEVKQVVAAAPATMPAQSARNGCDHPDGDDDSSASTTCETDLAAKDDSASVPEVSPPAVSAKSIPQPAKRTTVDSNGVKKTIVDADDDTGNHTVAKIEKPDPPTAQPATPAVQTPPTDAPPKKSKKKGKQKSVQDVSNIREAQPTAAGDRSLIRALGLKINKIVVDPGHGGHDTGTIGPRGLEEKDLVLDVSLRLGKLLASRLGSEIVFTRTDDTFIPLETRTAIANHEGADLFISVHANSSPDPDARGTETYYLNFTSNPEALEVAARENAVSNKSIHELQDLVKKIALKEKIEESEEFAADVESSLNSGLSAKNPGLRDRGVKKAPFVVLVGANMPSILAEISFVSNPDDERRLKTPEYRQRIAESLYRGVARYVNGLSGVKLASKIDKSESQ
ncbi:MAG TPA: N-acetylmuramoyl-L-alanine amidase [Terriglobales bacterium]